MIKGVKKYSVIIIIAILLALFSVSLVGLSMERPDYSGYCLEGPKPVKLPSENCSVLEVTQEERKDCQGRDGFIDYEYDEEGCPVSYECNTCRAEYDEALENYRLIGFIITSFLGVIAIIVGLYSSSKEEVVQWIFSGFLIGGMLSVAVGTVWYFSDMGRFVRPIVLLVELGLVIWIAMKTAKK